MAKIKTSFGWDWKSFLIGVDGVKNHDYLYFWIYLGFLEVCIYFKIHK